MPYRINGFGTGYYGKANIHRLRAQCEHCKQIGVMESYDTTLFITGLYVPLIPIGGKRILESCPSCTTHRAVPLSSWNQSKEAHKAELVEKLQANPNDKEALLKALGVSIAYQDHALFELLRESLIGDQTNDADIQYNLAQAHRFFGEPALAADAYRRSLAVKNNPEVHEDLALLLLGMKNPKEAEKHIEHLLTVLNKEKLWLPYSLVTGYQAEGMHPEAASVLDKVEQLYPDATKEKDWVKLRNIANKYQNSQKKVGSPLQLSINQSTNDKGNALANRIPLLALPLLLVGFAIWHIATAIYVGNNRTVHVIGALPDPYQVTLNGQSVTLSPFQITKVVLPEGDISIEAGKGAPAAVAGTVHFETSFWTRPFLSPVLVINPDKLVMFYVQTVVYSTNPNGENPPPDFFANSKEYVFSGIDYPFESPPQTIKIKNGITTKRKALTYFQFPPVLDRLKLLAMTEGPEQLPECFAHWLDVEPSNQMVLGLVMQTTERDKAIEILKTRLSEKPIRTDWHRIYQNLQLENNQEASLKAEYGKLATDSDRDPTALYLLARISTHDEAIALLNEAIKSGKPAAIAHYSLGNHLLCEGKFQEAAKEFDQAGDLLDRGSGYSRFAMEAYLAAKRFDAIYKLLDSAARDPSKKLDVLFQRLQFQAMENNREFAEETKKSIRIAVTSPTSFMDRAEAEQRISILEATVQGDIARYVQLSRSAPDMQPTVTFAILQGKTEEAVRLLEEKKSGNFRDTLAVKALVLLALGGENHPKAEQLKASFLEELGVRPDSRELRDILAKKKPFNMEKVRQVALSCDDKSPVLYLAAKWFPEHAKELRELAAKLNFQKDEIALCLKKIKP